MKQNRGCRLPPYCRYILIILLTIISTSWVTGCGGSDTSLLNRSLNNMNKKTASYQFKGSATIDMGEIRGTGTVEYEGCYRAPGEVYIKMDTGIQDQGQQIELFIANKKKIFNRLGSTEWSPYQPPPNLSDFQQPGHYQNPVNLLENLTKIIDDPKNRGETELDGKKLTVFSGKANTSKLKSLITEQLTMSTSSSEEEIAILKTLINNMKVSQDYLIYIEPNSELIMKLELNQKTNLKIHKQEANIVSKMSFDYFGFNEPVKMPKL